MTTMTSEEHDSAVQRLHATATGAAPVGRALPRRHRHDDRAGRLRPAPGRRRSSRSAGGVAPLGRRRGLPRAQRGTVRTARRELRAFGRITLPEEDFLSAPDRYSRAGAQQFAISCGHRVRSRCFPGTAWASAPYRAIEEEATCPGTTSNSQKALRVGRPWRPRRPDGALSPCRAACRRPETITLAAVRVNAPHVQCAHERALARGWPRCLRPR